MAYYLAHYAVLDPSMESYSYRMGGETKLNHILFVMCAGLVEAMLSV